MNDQETLPARPTSLYRFYDNAERDVRSSKGALHRFPIEDLAAALRVDLGVSGGHRPGDPVSGLALLAEMVGVSYSTVQRRQRDGLSERDADEWAIRCGLQPELVWPGLLHVEEPEQLVGAAAANAAKSRCPRGHRYDFDLRGWRFCRPCSRDRPRSDHECLLMATPDTHEIGGAVESPWMTVEEAAAYSKMSPRTVRRRIIDGDLPAYRHRGVLRVKVDEVDRMLEGVDLKEAVTHG